jgi:hypothetical protein
MGWIETILEMRVIEKQNFIGDELSDNLQIVDRPDNLKIVGQRLSTDPTI